jgi:membrane-bound lytic murein transglycosylase
MLLGLLKAMPQVGQVGGDIVVRQMDFEAAQDLADRLAAANPLAMAEKQLPKDLPDDVKAFIAHLMGTVQQQQQALQQAELEKKYRMGVEQMRQQGKLASDRLWADHEMRHEHVRQDGENRRLLAKEHAQNLREEVKSRTKLEDTQMRNDESWREAKLDAATDLHLGQDRSPNNEFHREHA